MTTTRRKAENTSGIFARRGPTDQDVTDPTECFPEGDPRKYAVVRFEHDEDGEGRTSRAMRARRAGSFGESGPFWGSGSVEIEIPAGGIGFLDILHGLFGEPTPVSVPLPDKTLVPAGTQVSAVVGDHYFQRQTRLTADATENVTLVPAQNLATPAAKVVVKATKTLSGTGNQHESSDDNLSGYMQPLTLTVTPASAGLTDTNTPGRVTVQYTDWLDQARTHLFEFPTGALAVAQTWELPMGAYITGVTTSGFNAGTFGITATVTEKTLAYQLGSLGETVAVTVTPGNTPELANASTPAKVDLNYLDRDAELKKVELSFPDASKDVAQTTHLPEDATLLWIEATGWKTTGSPTGTVTVTAALVDKKGTTDRADRNPNPNYPGRLRFKFASANSNRRKIVVHGSRKVGLLSTDRFRMKEEFALDGTETDVTLHKFFYETRKIEVLDANGAAVTGGTVEITSRPGEPDVEDLQYKRHQANPSSHPKYKGKSYKTVIKMADTLPDGWDIEGEVGKEPRTIRKAVPIDAEIAASDNVGIALNILSTRVDKRQTLHGDPFFEHFIPTVDDPTYKDDFHFITERFITDIGLWLELDGAATLFDSAPITITHNYDFGKGKKGSPFRDDLESTSLREVTTNIATSYEAGTSEEDKFIRWDEKFRNKEPVSAIIGMNQCLLSGQQASVTWYLEYCEVTGSVRVVASGPGNIPITIPLKSVPDPETGDTSEITVILISQDFWT